jgi:hypothetical protein
LPRDRQAAHLLFAAASPARKVDFIAQNGALMARMLHP